VLQRVAACYSVLQRVSACYSVLQRVAAYCKVLQLNKDQRHPISARQKTKIKKMNQKMNQRNESKK